MTFKVSPEEMQWLRETIAGGPELIEQRARELADASRAGDANAARGLCLLAEMYQTTDGREPHNTTEENTMFGEVTKRMKVSFSNIIKDARHFAVEGDLWTPGRAKQTDPVQARVDRLLDEMTGKPSDATAEPRYSPTQFTAVLVKPSPAQEAQ